jgi:DNA-binding MarR family transcriptional regulator
MDLINEQLQLFVRRFGLLNAACCDECCGEQVSMVQSHILFEVRRAGSPSIQMVADRLGIDITTFSRQVKSLEKKGLVARRVSPDDRRVFLLGLTGEGLDVLERIDGYMSDRLELVFSQMSEFERDTVVRSLTLLNEAVTGADAGRSGQEGKVACCK